MKSLRILLSLIIFNLINSNRKKQENTSKKKNNPDRELFEKKRKVLACTYFTNNVISLYKNDKSFKEMLKNFDSLSNENTNVKNKISYLITVNCYTKISLDIANKIFSEIPKKGKLDFEHEKQYSDLLKVDDLKQIENDEIFSQNLKEINEILKEIQAEELILNRNRKEDPNFEKNMKDFEEKMKKNYEKRKQEKQNTNKKGRHTIKKKRGNEKKPYNNTKWEIVEVDDEELFNFKDFFINPVKFMNMTGVNSICGMLIMSLLTINFFKIVKNTKKNENKEVDMNEFNKKENEVEEEEGEEGDDNENNINENDNTPLGKKDGK